MNALNRFETEQQSAVFGWFRSFRIILQTQLFLIRTGWHWLLFLMTLQPLTMLAFMYFLVGSSDPDTMFYIVSGNMVMALSISSMLALGQELGRLKTENALDYYATLPVQKSALMFAIVTRSMLFSFIPITLILIFSVLLFDVRISLHPLFIVAVALSGYSMAGVGAVIGFYSPDGQIASLLTQIIQPLVVFLSPVYIPVEQLPDILQFTSHFIPTTYVARVIRDLLSNQINNSTVYSLVIVVIISIATLILVEKRLDWNRE